MRFRHILRYLNLTYKRSHQQKVNRRRQKLRNLRSSNNNAQLYLRMSVLAQAINVTINVNDGTRMKVAESSMSQWIPVKPNGQWHSYLRGGEKSRHRPPFWHGWNRHSFSFTHSRPDIMKPAGQLCVCKSNVCQ